MTITIKPSDTTLKDVAELVKKTGITRHNILLRLINIGLEQAKKDKDALFTTAAIGSEDDDKKPA